MRAGRKRKLGERQPDGDPKRKTSRDRLAALITPERRRHAAGIAEVPTDVAGVKTLRAEPMFERLHSAGRIDDDELATCRAIRTICDNWAAVSSPSSVLKPLLESCGHSGDYGMSEAALAAAGKYRTLLAALGRHARIVVQVAGCDEEPGASLRSFRDGLSKVRNCY